MTMNAAQKAKKAHAMAESRDHMMHSNVVGNRNGRDHESHKTDDMAADDKARMSNGGNNAY